MLGQWIDGLTEEERDRLVRHQYWYDIDGKTPMNKDDKCLVQIVRGGYLSEAYSVPWTRRIANKYDKLVTRFGLDRIVRAVKLRAGATLEDLTPTERDAALTPTREAVEV